MEHVAEILHELIDAARSMLSPNRVGELHGLADKVGAAASATADAAGVLADATGDSTASPGDPAAEIARLQKTIAELRALQAPVDGAAPA